ncbi:alcohol dehydrogenase catalytic domain-containing protein [Aeromonas caviae]
MTHTQAWCWHAPGEPDQLTLTRQALPTPGPDEVLVANRIIAFNPVDWKLIEQGHPHWQPGHVPGVDGMGTLVALGANVTHLRPGTRVAYHTDLRHGGSFRPPHPGVRLAALMPVPDALSDEAAAALPCPGLTAWQALAKLPHCTGGPAHHGAGSSVGRFAVQLALQKGARVFASASPRHHQWLKQLGVQGVSDYRDPTGWPSCRPPTAVNPSRGSSIWSPASRQKPCCLPLAITATW